MSRARRAPAVAGLVLLLAGCRVGSGPAAAPESPAPAFTTSAATAGSPTPGSTAAAGSVPRSPQPRPDPPAAVPVPRRPVVVLDPGHNGGNAAHPEVVTRPVEAGNGRHKPCNEVGAETAGGYPEHAFTWDVAVRTRALLAAHGVDVRLTRPDDAGVGPCVNVRGRFGNALRADAVVSVHADGAPAGGSGFHVIQAVRAPAGAARLALAVRAALRSGSGLGYADYLAGGDGLDARDDLAGLNLSSRPSVFVELGNMRNHRDAALHSTPAGRQRIATALADGILAFLGR